MFFNVSPPFFFNLALHGCVSTKKCSLLTKKIAKNVIFSKAQSLEEPSSELTMPIPFKKHNKYTPLLGGLQFLLSWTTAQE